MKFLIDTNVLSEIRKGTRADARVRSWYWSVDPADKYMSVLVVGEVREGIERVRDRDPAKARVLEGWLTRLEDEFDSHLVTIDEHVCDAWGRMSAIRPLSVPDALQAATAQVHEMTLVTRNTQHVANLGVPVLDPFT